MPITLKLSRSSRPEKTAAEGAQGSSPSAEPAPASPSRRTVSFTQHQQPHHHHSSTHDYDTSPPPATPFKTGASAEWHGNHSRRSKVPSQRNDESVVSIAPSVAPLVPPTPPKRPRSPTPPSSAYVMALPLPRAKSSANVSTFTLTQSLTRLIVRYASLAGYTGIDLAALDYLQESVHVYVESVLLQGSESALLGARAELDVRDVLGIMSCQEHYEDRSDEEEATDVKRDIDTTSIPHPLAEYVSGLIAWRHNIPDYFDDDPTVTLDDKFPRTTWATNGEVTSFLQMSGTGAVDDEEDQLLSRKSRYLEKSRREEIPDHLPELPAAHTWKQTFNEVRSDAPASTILSRLEARLVSSRLVQSSLRSLIGRLDDAGQIDAAQPILQSDAQADPDTSVTREEPGSNLPSPAAATPSLSRSGSRSLSVRLRPQSINGVASFLGADASTASEPTPKRRRGLSEYDHNLHLDFAGQPQMSFPASPLALTTPTSASHHTSFHFPPRRTGTLVSPALSTPGISIHGATSAGGYPWSNPLMSPVTPVSAGIGSGKSFPMTSSASISTDLLEGNRSPAFHYPTTATGEGEVGVGVGVGVGGGRGGGEGQLLLLPPVVNFKSNWYAKKT